MTRRQHYQNLNVSGCGKPCEGVLLQAEELYGPVLAFAANDCYPPIATVPDLMLRLGQMSPMGRLRILSARLSDVGCWLLASSCAIGRETGSKIDVDIDP